MAKINMVRDYITWLDVKAYGTYESGSSDNEIWLMDGKLYRLCYRELPAKEHKELNEALSLTVL